ncbi:MAG: four helix bundle protein [Prevotella sp.]|jgi:four helix bundle protein|nr:four helix bundle protein [Prevotella sp.]
MTRNFEDIIAWKNAHSLVILVYRITKTFPDYERFGLCSQFQRAAVSIPANIAEGYKKLSKADKLRFFNISQGSIEECRYYCILSRDLGYINEQVYTQLLQKILDTSYMLNSYIKGVIENKGLKD